MAERKRIFFVAQKIVCGLSMALFALGCTPAANSKNTTSSELLASSIASAAKLDRDPQSIVKKKAREKAFVMKTPTTLLKEVPAFDDDLNFNGMLLSIERQQAAFDRQGLKGSIVLGGKTFPLAILQTSLTRFKELTVEAIDCIKATERSVCIERFNDLLQEKFNFYGPNGEAGTEPGKKVHYTAYYSPVYDASLTKTAQYPYAIYSMPSDERLRTKTREQIIWEGALEGQGLELFYIADLFDLYILHLEGGGAVKIDGNIRYLSYTGHNSNKFNFISKYMKQMNYLTEEDSSTLAQKAFLGKNPGKWREIYSQCPGYIYFKESYTEPLGMESIPLTDNRSIAQDRKHFSRKGLLTFIRAERPILVDGVMQMIPMSRFYIDQDTGSAIKGEARADIYFGFGEDATLAGQTLNTYGEMVYLIAK